MLLYPLRKHLGSLLNLSAGGVFSSFWLYVQIPKSKFTPGRTPPPPSFNSKRIVVAVLRLTLFCISTVCWFFFSPTSTVVKSLQIRTNFTSGTLKIKEKQQNTEVLEWFGLCSLSVRFTEPQHCSHTHTDAHTCIMQREALWAPQDWGSALLLFEIDTHLRTKGVWLEMVQWHTRTVPATWPHYHTLSIIKHYDFCWYASVWLLLRF